MRAQEASLAAGDLRQRIFVERVRIAEVAPLQPMMVELHSLHVDAVETEGMDVAVADAGPVHELDAQLVGRIGRADEVVLIQAQHLIEQNQLRDGRFANTDGADLLRFDEFDLEARQLSKDLRERGRGHPAGGASTDDHDLADPLFPHAVPAFIIWAGAMAGAAQQRAMNSAWLGMARAVCS